MQYLVMAILSSVLISTLMRMGEKKIENNMAMFAANYVVCAVLSRVFGGKLFTHTEQTGISFAVVFGVFSGILYLASFVLLQINIRKNGVVMAAAFMKLGVLVPTLMAVVLFRERPRLLQMLGFLLALTAILMLHYEKEAASSARYKLLLVFLLFCSGFTDATANIFDKLGNADLKDQYLFVVFTAAFFCAVILWIIKKQGIRGWDILMGILIGVPNYFSARFLLLSLHDVPAVIVYPVYSVSTIALISAVGAGLFQEKLSRRKMEALGMIFLALLLLNLQ